MQCFLSRFNQANSLQTHKDYMHGDNNRKHCCPLCGRLYKTMQLLRRHCRINHCDQVVTFGTSSTSGPIKRQFYCSECGDSFVAKSLLTKHKTEQHSDLAPEQLNVLQRL